MKFLTNKFTLLRIIAASMVIVGHAYDLQDQADIAKQLTGWSIGELGVFIFFAMSGYLIFSSAERKPDIVAFARARLLRILPGLWAMLCITTAVIAFFYSVAPGASTKYILCNA